LQLWQIAGQQIVGTNTGGAMILVEAESTFHFRMNLLKGSSVLEKKFGGSTVDFETNFSVLALRHGAILVKSWKMMVVKRKRIMTH
jgi:hypothetical protein